MTPPEPPAIVSDERLAELKTLIIHYGTGNRVEQYTGQFLKAEAPEIVALLTELQARRDKAMRDVTGDMAECFCWRRDR